MRGEMKQKRLGAKMALAAALAITLAIPLAAAGGVSRSRAWTVTTIASNLDNPRGLLLGSDGTLLLAEAGHGGDVCRPDPAVPTGKDCLGTSSQISKVDTSSGAHTPVVTGLFSFSAEGVVGVDGIAAQTGRRPGSTTGQLFGVISEYPQQFADWSCDNQPSDCASVLAAARDQAGQLIQFTTTGTWHAIAGVGAADYQWTQTNHSLSPETDANPYGVLPLLRGTWVADAASNTLNWIPPTGGNIVASGIPAPGPGFPLDGVPTCVTMVRGNLYAADLAGRLWKRDGKFAPDPVSVVDANGKDLLHHVTGCTADTQGNIYLVDMWGTPGPPIPAGPQSTANTGSVVELAKDGTAILLAGGLNFPNGIVLASDGSLYVSVGSTCPASGSPFPYCAKGGQIIRIAKS